MTPEIDRLKQERDKWKRRALMFQEAYQEASFQVCALQIQKLRLEAFGADKVTAMQNKSLREKLLECCRERNLLKREVSDKSETPSYLPTTIDKPTERVGEIKI